jgi:hypothetical protein
LQQTGSRKPACFPATGTYLINMILEESQRNITSCLLENPVPCTGIAEEPPTTSGTKPQTLTVTPPASQNTTVVPPSDFSPVPDTFGRKQEQPMKHGHSRKGSGAFLTISP